MRDFLPPSPEHRRGDGVKRSGALIAGAFGTASLMGLALLAVMARWLDPEQNAQFQALWAVVFGIGAAMSAVEAEASRLASLSSAAGNRVSGQVGWVAAIGAALGVGAALAAVVLVPGVRDITATSSLALATTVAAVALFAPLCLTRGVLLGTGQVTPYAGVVFGEAALRVVLAVALWQLVTTPSIVGAVLAIAIGGLAWLPVLRRLTRSVDWSSPDRSPARALRAVGALGAANALTALMLAAYPALVTAVVGSTAGLATLFATVILTRAPLVAVTPLQAVAVPLATRALHDGRHGLIRRLWAQVAVGTTVVTGVAFAAGWWVGPWAIRVFQGPDYVARPLLVAVLLATTCVLAVVLLQGAVLVAAGRHSWVTAMWLVAVGGTTAWLALGPGTPETRGMVALAVGTALAYASSSWGVLRVSGAAGHLEERAT